MVHMAAGRGVANLEEQHQQTAGGKAPPELDAPNMSNRPYADDEHGRLSRCRHDTGLLVAQYLIGAQQDLRHGKRYQHQGEDTQHAGQFYRHLAAWLHAEEDADKARHVHQDNDDSHKRGNEGQRLLDKDLQSSQVALTHQHAANGKHRLDDTVDKHIGKQQHLQTYRPDEEAVATQILQHDIIDHHDGNGHQAIADRNRGALLDIGREDACNALARPLQAIGAAGLAQVADEDQDIDGEHGERTQGCTLYTHTQYGDGEEIHQAIDDGTCHHGYRHHTRAAIGSHKQAESIRQHLQPSTHRIVVDIVIGHLVQLRLFRHGFDNLAAKQTDAQRDSQSQRHHRQDGGGEGARHLVHIVAADGMRTDGVGTETDQEAYAVEHLNQREYQVNSRDCILTDDMADNHRVGGMR